MLYSFGDSITYGFNFLDFPNREAIVYTSFFSKKLRTPFKNLSLPGSSNWRTARIIQSLDLNKDDVVLIMWSCVTRMELGINTRYNLTPPHNDFYSQAGDVIEVDKNNSNIITKRFYPQLSQCTSDAESKLLNNILYNKFYNEHWYEEMFKIMYCSVVHKLCKIGCKWIMFNGWDVQCQKSDYEFDDNYLFPKNTMSSFLGVDRSKYWNKEEHQKASLILYEKFNEIYK